MADQNDARRPGRDEFRPGLSSFRAGRFMTTTRVTSGKRQCNVLGFGRRMIANAH